MAPDKKTKSDSPTPSSDDVTEAVQGGVLPEISDDLFESATRS